MPANSKNPPPDAFVRDGMFRFSTAKLLIALILLLLFTPFIEDLKNGEIIEAVLMTLVLVSAVLAVGGRRRSLLVATVLVVPAVAGRWLHHGWPDRVPTGIHLVAGLLFIAFVVSQLLAFILRAPRVDSEVLCAGISGFLLVGLLWTLAYVLVDWAHPGSFAFNVASLGQPRMDGFNGFYYSFMTLCTVGYGDITPVSRVARMLAVLEAITGMFYVAVLIARLVALHTTSTPANETDAARKS